MSHHLDTPLAAQTGQLFIDDLYVFPGQGSTVFVLDINSDVNGLHTEPGFHPEARYEIKVHVNGAAFEDLTYRVAFAEPNSDGRQALTLHALTGDQARGDAGTGDLVLEVPHDDAILSPGTRIGVWAATKLATDAGGWRQVNRAGHPMMWPIFWPNDVQFTDPANVRHPSEDYAAEGDHMASHVAAVVAASGTSAEPDVYGLTVARTLLPDVLPYVVGTPASFGFATRNGRTLADNAPEAMMSLVVGTAVPGGLRPSVTEAVRSGQFPYLTPA